MRDLIQQQRCPHRHRDPLDAIQCNLHRAKERQLLERLNRIRIERLPDGEIKEELLDLRSQARRHFNFTLKV